MAHVADQAVTVLRRAGVNLESGLTDQEIADVQQRYRFAFNPDHRTLIQAVLPTGPKWLWPRLVPVYSHRYAPAAPAPAGSPELSVHQTDIIYYGPNLVD
jgi:hypothetical protein